MAKRKKKTSTEKQMNQESTKDMNEKLKAQYQKYVPSLSRYYALIEYIKDIAGVSKEDSNELEYRIFFWLSNIDDKATNEVKKYLEEILPFLKFHSFSFKSFLAYSVLSNIYDYFKIKMWGKENETIEDVDAQLEQAHDMDCYTCDLFALIAIASDIHNEKIDKSLKKMFINIISEDNNLNGKLVLEEMDKIYEALNEDKDSYSERVFEEMTSNLRSIRKLYFVAKVLNEN